MTVPTITLNGTFKNAAGDPEVGTVTFMLNTPLLDGNGNVVVTTRPVVSTLDGSGRLTDTDGVTVGLVLAATSGPDLEPTSGVVYKVTEELGALRPRRYNIVLPHTSPVVDLADVAPVAETGLVWTDAPSQAEIDDETAARIAGDAALDGRLDTVETTLPTKADLVGGTVPDGQIPAAITRDAELSAAIAAVINGAPAGGDTLAELEARLAVVEALGSLATDAELIAAVAALIGSADSAGDTLGELQALIGLRMLKSANLSDVANVSTALDNLGFSTLGKSLRSAADAAAVRALIDAQQSGTYETPAGAQSKADAKVADAINDGVTTVAPSQNAVFDALAEKGGYDRTAIFDVYGNALADTNWSSFVAAATSFYAFLRTTGSNQNDSITLGPKNLEAGTWSLALLHRADTNRGVYTLEISHDDGGNWSALGTVDGYSASGATTRTILAGLAIATAGRKRVRLTMASKNASSSSYLGAISGLSMIRTGA